MMQGTQQLETSVIEQSVSEQLKEKLLEITEQNQSLATHVEDPEVKELVIVVQKDPSITQDQIIASGKDQYTLILSHQTIATIASITSPIGGYIGYGIGHAAGIEVGAKVAQAAQEELTKLGENSTSAILKAVGLENVPFAKFLVKAEVSNLAHETAEKLRQEAINLSAKQGSVYGAFLAGGATIAALELLNLIGLVVQYTAPSVKRFAKNYLTTPLYNYYFKPMDEENLRALAARLDKEEEAKLQASENKVDALVSQLEESNIGDDWFLVDMDDGKGEVVTFSKIATAEQPKSDEKQKEKSTLSLSV